MRTYLVAVRALGPSMYSGIHPDVLCLAIRVTAESGRCQPVVLGTPAVLAASPCTTMAALQPGTRHCIAWRTVGVVEAGGRQLVALEDVARHYRRPSICDIKVGFRTWYPSGDAAYIQRCQLKDAATTQSTLGFKVCGMQACRWPRFCSALCRR